MKPEDYFDYAPVSHLNHLLGDKMAGTKTKSPHKVDYLLTFDSYHQQLNETIHVHNFAQVNIFKLKAD